jgi:K+-sensing histidine kinase KdpD
VRRTFVLGRIIVSIGIVALITFLYFQFFRVNPTTVALSYLVAILLIATRWGIFEATAGSIAAVLCFNFFFLPPFGIVDPQNWVAFIAFLATAIVASQLSGRARQREIQATAKERDLERLYALSRALLLSPGGASVTGAIARHIADAHGATGRWRSPCAILGRLFQNKIRRAFSDASTAGHKRAMFREPAWASPLSSKSPLHTEEP